MVLGVKFWARARARLHVPYRYPYPLRGVCTHTRHRTRARMPGGRLPCYVAATWSLQLSCRNLCVSSFDSAKSLPSVSNCCCAHCEQGPARLV
jgi:hypothetical protein